MEKKEKKRRSIGDNILIGIVIFALLIVVGVSIPLGFGYMNLLINHIDEDAVEDAHLIATLVDPDMTLRYAETRKKDPYYERIRKSLNAICSDFMITGCSVSVPKDGKWIYIWDTNTDGDNYDIGDAYDPDIEDIEIENEVFYSEKHEKTVAYTDGDGKTFYLVYVPVYNDEGNPVAAVEVSYQRPDVSAIMMQTMAVVLMLTALMTAAVMAIVYAILRERIIIPITTLTEGAEKIADNLDKEEPVKIRIDTNNELETLAEAFNKMEVDIREYISELETVTAEKERIGTELDLAAQIQKGVLPKLIPPFTDNDRFELYASMSPAREVGGDFYDFFMIDDDRIALVIGDVSGKGIPAALFMVVSKALIKSALTSEKSPGEALSDVNAKLLDGNELELFVTVWIAVIDLSTGRGVSANAGHENPALRRAGDKYEMIRYTHSPMVGAFDELVFNEREFVIGHGDSVFVYTDGATEATNSDGKMFGEKRLEEELNRCVDAHPEELLTDIRETIDDFTGDASMFDDLTMLAFRLK